MELKQKKKRLFDLTKLILLCKGFPETQMQGIDERIKLKEEIQIECKHDFMNAGDIEFYPDCSKLKMT